MSKVFLNSFFDEESKKFPYIAKASELRNMAKDADYQSIILDDLQIDIVFDNDIGITEYIVDIYPVIKGHTIRHKVKQFFFYTYKAAKAFVEEQIILHSN